MAVYRTSSWPHGSLFNLGHGIANCDGEFRCGNTRWDFSSCARMRGGAGRTRTNHQSVMEYGGVRPAHPVEHHALELEQFRFLGISTKGESYAALLSCSCRALR